MLYIKCHFCDNPAGIFYEFPGCVECSSSGTPNTLGRLHFSMELTESRQAPADDEAEDASPELSSRAHGFHDMGAPVIIYNENMKCGW